MDKRADSAAIALLTAHQNALPTWVSSLGLAITQKSKAKSLKEGLTEAGTIIVLEIDRGFSISLASSTDLRTLTPQEVVFTLLYAIGQRSDDLSAAMVTTTADFPGLEDLVSEWGLAVVRTLPGMENVDEEVAQRPEAVAFGATIEEGELMLCMDDERLRLVCTALVDALRAGLDLAELVASHLSGRHYHTGDVHVNLGSPVDCALRLMDIRADENRLFCHMMVAETLDYLPGLAMPGDPDRHLRSRDIIDWTLSDTSHVTFMADDSSNDVTVRIQAHGDSMMEADIVYEALAKEAVSYVRQGPQDLTEED